MTRISGGSTAIEFFKSAASVRRSTSLAFLATVIAATGNEFRAFESDFGRIEPKVMPVVPIKTDDSGDQDLQPSASAEPIVGRLNAVVLVPRPEMVVRSGKVAPAPRFKASRIDRETPLPPVAQGPGTEAEGVTGVQLRGLTPPAPDVFAKEIGAAYVGKPISLQSINTLTRDIILYYRRHDRPVVDVILPEQEITSGVLQFVVVEGRVGEVRVEGNRWFSGERLARQVRLRPGEPIAASGVLADVTWLNGNPFREVNAAYTPGREFGTTDVVLKVRDRFPLRVYAGYENSGNEVTGLDRWLTGFNWGNAFGLDHQLSYQFTASSDAEGLRAHSAIYTAPLPWRHTLSVFGTYSESSADPEVDGQTFHEGGRSWQASFRYTAPLRSIGKLTHDLFVGADFKRMNNDLEFGGTQAFRSDVDVAQVVGGYEAQARDRWGSTSLSGTAFYSPGGVTANNTTEVYQQASAFSHADYVYGRVNLERINKLPAGCSLRLKAVAQWSNGNLQASEQVGVGGYDTVRGYDEREARGDSGYLLSAELRSPPVSLFRVRGGGKDAADSPALNDQLQLLAFVDYGKARIHQALPGEPGSTDLASVGLGLRYAITPYVSVRFDYGWQLETSALHPGDSGAAHLGVIVSY
ncbi:MAG: ShlB/FhaC/HecB family hemolysin secretion/activation protein [Chthoniobacteraceae bacterium]